MPDFAYIARDIKGQRISGTISAGSDREALTLLSGRSLFPVEVQIDKGTVSVKRTGRVSGQNMAQLYSQMAALLKSGVPLLRTIAVLRDQSSNRVLKGVLADVHSRVEDGSTLADAMIRYPRVFDDMAVNMIRAGGEGGFLEEALERVSQFTEQYEDLKSRTVGAMAYPLFLAAVGSILVVVLIVFFVPKFAELFDSLRQRGELPALTESLLWISDFVRSWGMFVLIAMVAGFIALRTKLETEQGKRTRDRIKLRLPLMGVIFQHLAVARFCRVLGAMLRNGVPILKSLDISRGAAGNRVLADAIASASENISAGQSLAAPLGSSGYFPASVVEMISVAEESNTLDTILVQIADGLEKRTLRRLDLMVRLLEPLMLLILAVIVLFVVIALLIPVIKMSSTI